MIRSGLLRHAGAQPPLEREARWARFLLAQIFRLQRDLSLRGKRAKATKLRARLARLQAEAGA